MYTVQIIMSIYIIYGPAGELLSRQCGTVVSIHVSSVWFQYFNHVSDRSVQCENGTRNLERTVYTYIQHSLASM